MDDQLLDTWHIHNRINLYVLEAVAEDALDGVASNGGRSVKAVFAHIHNVRLMWMQEAAPDLMESLDKIPMKTAAEKATVTKAVLHHALTASGDATATLLSRGFESGRIKGFKPHPAAFLGYLISHESYHRGEIGIILNQAGTPLDNKISYGMWEWGVR